MKTLRRFSRRSFLGLVTGGAAIGGAALLGASESAQAFQSDNDRGTFADRKGQGYGKLDRPLSDAEVGRQEKGDPAAEREARERRAREARERNHDEPPEHPRPE